jgi:hypothetical protein
LDNYDTFEFFDGKIDDFKIYEWGGGPGDDRGSLVRNDPIGYPSTIVGEEEVASVQWQLIETWAGTVQTSAAAAPCWQLIGAWTGTVQVPTAYAGWLVVETWTGTVNTLAPPGWKVIESWTGAIGLPAWHLVETWTGTIEAQEGLEAEEPSSLFYVILAGAVIVVLAALYILIRLKVVHLRGAQESSPTDQKLDILQKARKVGPARATPAFQPRTRPSQVYVYPDRSQSTL